VEERATRAPGAFGGTISRLSPSSRPSGPRSRPPGDPLALGIDVRVKFGEGGNSWIVVSARHEGASRQHPCVDGSGEEERKW